MVDTRVQTNLVHDDDTSLLALFLERLHGRGNVRGGDHVLLVPNGRLDDRGVVDVGDEGDDEITVGHGGVEGFRVGRVHLNAGGTGERSDHLFGELDGSASDGELVTLLDDVLDSGGSDESTSEQQDLLVLASLLDLHTRSNTGKVFLDELAILDHGSTEFGENKGGSVDVGVVVLAVGDLSQGGGDGSVGVERTTDETDLSRGV